MKKAIIIAVIFFFIIPGVSFGKPRILAKGQEGDIMWVLMEKGKTITMERITGAGMSSVVSVFCMTEDIWGQVLYFNINRVQG